MKMPKIEPKAKKRAAVVNKTNAHSAFPKPVPVNAVQAGVLASIHHFAGAHERWCALRAKGATNRQITEQLNYELGLSGGGTFPRNWPPFKWVHHKRKPPRVWLLQKSIVEYMDKSPTIQGKTLVEMVRLLYQIPLPPDLDIPF